MDRKSLMGSIVPILGAACCMFVMFAAKAEEGLGPMAGAGGVMRDAERRAMTPVVVPKEAAATPNAEAPEAKTDVRLGAVRSKIIGSIASVRVFGSTNFAERVNLSERILKAVGSESDLTVGDVLTALATVRSDLLKEGYYLVNIQLARKNTYDAATQTLSVLVDEGRFGKVNVTFANDETGFWFSQRQIYSRFRYIEEGETFDYRRLRAALFDANSHPDLTIDTDIDVRKPLEGEGNDRRVARYADLELTVHESIPLHAVWEIDNYGLRDVNEWQTSLTVQYLNLTKHDDVITVSPAISLGAELVSCAASYMLPHDYWFGGSSTLYGGWSMVQVDDIIPALDLEGFGYFAGLQHSENLYNSDDHLLALSLGVLWRYIEDQYTVSAKSLKERGAHILPLSVALSYTGKRPDPLVGRNFGTLQGVFNVMNAGDEISKTWTGAEEYYWLVRAQLARLQSLFGSAGANDQITHNWQLFVKLEGQYTDQTLIPTEKLMMGGYNCLRGYRTRGYVGDYGLYGTFELRTPLLVDLCASLFGDRTNKVAFDRLQFLAFYDYGWTGYNNLPDSYEREKFLCSAGVGARLAVTQYSQLRCDLAFPMIESEVAKTDGDYDRKMEVYFGFQLQF